jgi:prophage regulatory protein
MQTKYLRDTDVAARYGTSRPTIWRWTAAGRFPAPVKLSPGCTRWRLSDIEEWEASKEAVQ